jgi:hypothetical protein
VATIAVVGCSVQPQVEISSGTVESAEFAKHVKYYDVQLPAGATGLEWLELRDWDINELHLRFATDRVGLISFLGAYRLAPSTLMEADRSEALPSQSGWEDNLPARFLEWQPSSWPARASDQVQDTNSDGLPLSVDLLVDNPSAAHPTVFVRIMQT